MTKRRVVITGLGVVCPLGKTVKAAWENALAGKSGVRLIDEFDTSDYAAKFAGLVPEFDPTVAMSAKDARKMDVFIQYGITAAAEAIRDAGLEDYTTLDKERVGTIFGSGIGGLGTIESNHATLLNSGPRRVSPFFIPASIVNMIAGQLAIQFGYQGPNLALATACTTGTHCIGLAHRAIVYGDAEVIIAGGAEKASTPVGIAGFAATRALSTRNHEPQRASRPWDVERDGFVLGDGSGSLVLEEYEHAKRRGAKIYAELAGFGMNDDAFHITRPSGVGAVKAMQMALKDAGVDKSNVDYINAHGTSTPAGDVEESLAIEKVLGEDASKQVSVSSTKSMTGHLLGAAGAIEAVFTTLALQDQVAPPTINLENPEEKCVLDYVPNQAKERRIEVAMSNSFGFGGTNGSLVFKKVND